jgi:hypothetical protein
MKNYSRAYNRYKQHTKFVRRVKNWFCKDGIYKEKWIKETLEGKRQQFLRTTGRPCNCYGCTYKQYVRVPKHKVMKEAFEE